MNHETGDGIMTDNADWKFTVEVARVFDAHVAKSVPYYLETQKLAVEMSDWFVSDRCKVYDLGCATGVTLGALLDRHPSKSIQCVGIDNSVAMLDQSRDRLDGRVSLVNADLLSYTLEPEISLIYSLYTLQFINPQRRQEMCASIYQSLSRRGAFVLVEKVLDNDPVVTDIYTHLHWSKKADMGFDVREIYGKAQALRGVLIPFTLQENIQMLEAVGFSRISVFFKWGNFCGILAIK